MKVTRKNKKVKGNTLPKNVKQYCYNVSKQDSQEMVDISSKYMKVKNYVYSNFSGIKSMILINNPDKNIRDVWTANGFIDNGNIPRRNVRNAIEDAASNIKSMGTNTLKAVKIVISKRKDLCKDQKEFLYYILKHKEDLLNVLTYKDISIQDKFKYIDCKTDLLKLLRRIVRKCKPKIASCKSNSMQMDEAMYSYQGDEICFSTRNKGKRIKLKVNTSARFSGNIRIKPEKGKITISRTIETKIRKNNFTEKKISVDSNFINAIDTSVGTSYGIGLNEDQKMFTNSITEKKKVRQPYYNHIKELKKSPIENAKKISNIYNNNLGKVKWNRSVNRYKEEIRKNINGGINQLIYTERPTTIFKELLNQFLKSNKNYKKYTKNLLNQWCKGIINTSIEYKTKQNNIELTLINPAYTSQECPICHNKGYRVGDAFHCHKKCFGDKGVPSGYVAALNLMARSVDTDITLERSPGKVAEILNKRLIDKNELSPQFFGEKANKPNQPRPKKSTKKS